MQRRRRSGRFGNQCISRRPADVFLYLVGMDMRFLSLLSLVFVTIAGCNKPSLSSDPIPQHDTFKILSPTLGETRVLCVWIPPEYNNTENSYPVLYMPDGGVKEDFPHIANTLAELVSTGSIPPLILVGIENTERRRDLTGPSAVASDAKIAPLSDGSSKFRQFIADELIPEINQRYRTTNERSIIGESAAGLFVVETMLLRPELFDSYIAMDPALYWNDRYLIRTAVEHLAKFPPTKIRFWFAGSDAGDIQPHTRELQSILKTNAPDTLEWKYSDEPEEKHSTIFRATKEAAIKWSLRFIEDER